MTTQNQLESYAQPGPLTTGGPGTTAALAALPSTLPDLILAVQGLLIHETGAAQSTTAHLRTTHQILAHLLTADSRPLPEPRPPAHRLTGCCRHFTLITVAALRAHAIPARARCGFAKYFTPGLYGDHWVAEYWNADTSRWILTDAQLTPELRAARGITFTPDNVPREQFAGAGDAWISYRNGELDPSRCGLGGEDQSGSWWIAGNLIRDVAALAKMELLPWDVWGAMPEPDAPIDDILAEELDQLAAITADPDTAAESRTRYNDERFRVPARVHNFLRRTEEPVID